MKKVFCIMSFLLIASMTISLAACTNSPTNSSLTVAPTIVADATDDPTTTDTSAETPVADMYSLPLSTTGETLTVAGAEIWTGKATVSDALPIFAAMKEATGISIEWECYPSGDYNTKMGVRFASGMDLPDIALLPDLPSKYISTGIVVPINEYIDNFAVGLQKLFVSEPALRPLLTYVDGNIYVLPGTMTALAGGGNDKFNPNAINVRRDWMKALGITEDPKTIDTWFDLLEAFKNDDPNGNGQADEIAISGSPSALRSMLGWSYGLHLNMNSGIYPDANGVVQYEYISDAYKALLIKAKEWNDAGIVDPLVWAYNGDTYNANVMSGMVGCVLATSFTPPLAYNPAIKTNTGNEDAGLWTIPVPSVEGYTTVQEALLGTVDASYFGITKDCANVELAVKWLDYVCFSEQGILWNEYGIEDLSYSVKDGKYVYADEYINGADGLSAAMINIGGFHYAMPQVLTLQGRTDVFNALATIPAEQVAVHDFNFERVKKSPYYLPCVLATEDETAVLTSTMPDINTYIEEMFVNFVTGKTPIDDFDTYVETIKGMGIEKVIQVKQAQNDRYMSTMK